MRKRAKAPRLFVPEVIQTSALDCGPACLKSLLGGFGIEISYDRLREACHTGLDGTSIDTLEEVANHLGLQTEQTVLPTDTLLLPESDVFPAIAVIVRPPGITHFVVIWRRSGPWLQVMDPAAGRRWVKASRLIQELYIHQMPVEAAEWCEWASSGPTLKLLTRKLRNLGVSSAKAAALTRSAQEAKDWRALATLEGRANFLASLNHGDKVVRKSKMASLLTSLNVPESFWPVGAGAPDAQGAEQVTLRGGVLLRALGRNESTASDALPPLLASVKKERPVRPALEALRMLGPELTPILKILAGAMTLATGAAVAEALLFRSLIDIGHDLQTSGQRLGALTALGAFLAALLIVDYAVATAVLRVGRWQELRLRMRFLSKLPQLGEQYFRSRPISDLAERGHCIHLLRQLPVFAFQFFRTLSELVLTLAAVLWLFPQGAPLILLLAACALLPVWLAEPTLAESSLRLRTQAGALSRFYLDALRGLSALRSHSATGPVRYEHDLLLEQWRQASFSFQWAASAFETTQFLACFAVGAWVLHDLLTQTLLAASSLLLIYWILKLPILAQSVARLMVAYPHQRNILLRLLELLNAPGSPPALEAQSPAPNHALSPGVALHFEKVSVVAAGHPILQEIDLTIRPGEHVAIVGRSGAGKSSLVSLLLGVHTPSSGRILLDDKPLDPESLAQLRRSSAWVEPGVHLWNRSLHDNLKYGYSASSSDSVHGVLERADLMEILEKLPQGLQTRLGEEGGLVSGGEGQRIRLGRALFLSDARLVVLDEPFRGLPRPQRRELMAKSRALWRKATVLYVTHDLEETRAFDRVIVIEGGQIVEDGPPSVIAEKADSIYSTLIRSEGEMHKILMNSAGWRQIELHNGGIREKSEEVSTP